MTKLAQLALTWKVSFFGNVGSSAEYLKRVAVSVSLQVGDFSCQFVTVIHLHVYFKD
jgi:hypothetical protein